jgi:hypothetical protein
MTDFLLEVQSTLALSKRRCILSKLLDRQLQCHVRRETDEPQEG